MQQFASITRHPGAEPIRGYRLIEPLGQGGFGEVWKCEAPGGLFKAIKFVRTDSESGEGNPARQEFESLERVKTLRHPFVLSLDRIEQHDDELLVIMELADHSVHDLFSRYRTDGHPGIPRDELLGYLLEAAEALDWMNFDHGLQHLDVKPHNLFIISGHVKVADFGLVHSLGDSSGEDGPTRRGGVTPLYSAPEMLRGSLSRHSDQYSLAVLYQQMLTGCVPFWSESVYELMMQHLSGDPDLSALPDRDRSVVARALSKVPEQRYSSCMEFVQSLLGTSGQQSNGALRRSGMWRRMVSGSRDTGESAPVSPSRVLPTHDMPTQRTSTPPPISLPAKPPLPALTPSPYGSASEQAQGSPTAVTLPGFKFLSCQSQSPLGDTWLAEDANGKPKRAFVLLNFVRYDARLIAHLQALRDPMLPATEVHWSPAERLILLTDRYEGTLRDRFEQRQREGKPGIPRAELLSLLRGAAECLDAVYASHGILHLGVCPRNLLVDGTRLRVADSGLVPLVWLPTGQSAGCLNVRYSAPELFDRRPSSSADQYSLALIYAEMLTGIHPRPSRSGSGINRRPGTTAKGGSAQVRSLKLDLDLLPVRDREVIARTLSDDPERRFPSCLAFIDALERAGRDVAGHADLYSTLPPVIPFSSLMGEPAGPDTILPTIHQIVHDLTAPSDPRKIHGPQNTRYFLQSDGSWQYRCPVPLFPGAMRLKVAGFCNQWGATVVREQGESFRLQLEVPVTRNFWERFKEPHRLEVEIQVEPLQSAQVRVTEARVTLRSLSKDCGKGDHLLAALGPQLFDSMRVYLQASPEQRTMERWTFTAPVQVYPVLPDLELAPTLDGVCRDISFGGIRFRLDVPPPIEQVYLHLASSPTALGHAILAQVARVIRVSDGVEIGARFAR